MSAINKRQQARNERALQDLISTVPGNNKCADCSASNPGWASWNLGIFLCMRCASLHRKLGTHISKVKSLSMDTWTSEQVDAMKTGGNNLSNKAYNPRNVRPALPLDPDEIDIAMEKYIRQKYQRRTLADIASVPRSNTGSTASTEDRPPPPPPKPSAKFASTLRTSSAAYPSPFSSNNSSPASAGRDPSAAEFIRRLPPVPQSAVAQQVSSVPPQHLPQQHMTPQYTPAPIQQQYSGMQTSGGTANPFYRQMSPAPFQTPLEASFQSMNIGQATLTPDMTGNWQQPRPNSTNPFLQAYTPPISPAPQTLPYTSQASFDPQHAHQQAPSATNPFMGLTRSQTMPTYQSQPDIYQANQQTAYPQTNGYTAQPLQSPPTNPFYNQSQVTSPAFPQYQNYFPPQDQAWPDNGTAAPDQSQAYQNLPPQSYQPLLDQSQAFQAPITSPLPQVYQQVPQPAFQPMRHDKSSILALYSQPQLAPARPIRNELSDGNSAEPAIANVKRRSVTMPIQGSQGPLSGSKNPFAALETSNGSAYAEVRPPMLDGPIDGRQSPDAFRSLSSAYR